MAKQKTAAAKAPAREEQGVTWVASTGVVWKETEITVEKLQKYSESYYGDQVTQKQRNLIFTGPPKIKVLDKKREEDPELSAWLAAMVNAPEVSAFYKMQQAWHGTMWYGPGIFNPVMAWEGGEYRLLALRYLPPSSFSSLPTGQVYRTYCALLPGIVQTADGEVQYWQIQDETDTTPARVENIFVVQDPIRPEIGSRPTVKAVVSVFAMLDYLWNAQMQKCHRTGSPLLFVRILGARSSQQLGGGKISDVDFAKQFMANWGKDSGFVLRDNMELVDPHISDTADNLETIDRLDAMISAHFSPAGYIAKSGPTIGGSSAPEKELLAAYVRGIQSWIESGFANLFQEVLDGNKLNDYIAVVELPDLEFDDREINIKIAESGDKTQSLFVNEKRELYGKAPLDEEGQARLKAEYAGRAPALAPVQVPVGNVGRATAPAKIVDTTEAELEAITTRARNKILAALKAEGIA